MARSLRAIHHDETARPIRVGGAKPRSGRCNTAWAAFAGTRSHLSHVPPAAAETGRQNADPSVV